MKMKRIISHLFKKADNKAKVSDESVKLTDESAELEDESSDYGDESIKSADESTVPEDERIKLAEESPTLNEDAIQTMLGHFKKIATPEVYEYNKTDYLNILACWHELSARDKIALKARVLTPEEFPSNKVFRTCTRVMTLFLMENKFKSTLHNPVPGQPPEPLTPKHRTTLTEITKLCHQIQAIALKRGGYDRPHSVTRDQQQRRLDHTPQQEVTNQKNDPTSNYDAGFRPITPTTSEAESNPADEKIFPTRSDSPVSPKSIFRPIPTPSVTSSSDASETKDRKHHRKSPSKS